jgi:hypothetical protein
VSTGEPLTENIRLSIVDPVGQSHLPADQMSTMFRFEMAPNFISGDYRLLFEQFQDGQVMDQAESPVLFRVQTEGRQFTAGPISHPLNANFAGRVALLGYDLPQPRVRAGESLPVTLHWQALKTMEASLINFNNLTYEQQEVWGKNDRWPRDIYSTMLWVPDEIVSDPFSLQVDPAAPDGIYYLLVGWYLPMGEAAVSVPLVQEGQLSEETHVRIGPIKVGQTPPAFTIDEAHPEFVLNRVFGEEPNLTLIGYDLAQQRDHIDLTLYWRVETPPNVDYTTFVHLRHAGEIIAQKDQPPLKGAYPTSLWDPGEIIADEIMLSLPVELPNGQYQLVIGMYDFHTGQRLTVPGNPANEVELLNVELH